jgi:hypothetical protein
MRAKEMLIEASYKSFFYVQWHEYVFHFLYYQSQILFYIYHF